MKKGILKKAAAIILAAAIGMASVSCGKGSDKDTVYVVMMVENGAFVDMKDGFIQELRDKGYSEDKLDIVYKCVIGQGNRGKSHPHCFVGNLCRCQRTVGRIGMYM